MTTNLDPGDRVVAGSYQALPELVSEDLMTLILNLATEVWTLRDRTRIVQTLLEEKGVVTPADFDSRRNHDDQLAAMTTDRDAFVERLLRSVVDTRRWAQSRADDASV